MKADASSRVTPAISSFRYPRRERCAMIERHPGLEATSHPIWDIRRAWRWADMINYVLHELFISLRFLDYELQIVQAQGHDVLVPAEDHQNIKNNVESAILPGIVKLQIADTRIACVNLQHMMGIYERRPYKYGE